MSKWESFSSYKKFLTIWVCTFLQKKSLQGIFPQSICDWIVLNMWLSLGGRLFSIHLYSLTMSSLHQLSWLLGNAIFRSLDYLHGPRNIEPSAGSQTTSLSTITWWIISGCLAGCMILSFWCLKNDVITNLLRKDVGLIRSFKVAMFPSLHKSFLGPL